MSSDRHEQHHAELITSSANPTIRLARSLERKRARQRERAMLVEGPRTIQSAVQNHARVRALLIDASRAGDLDPSVLSSVQSVAGRVLHVESGLFRQIAATEHPQPLIAICDMPESTISRDCSFVVAIDGVRDPGNLGTMIRSCAAAGADCIALLPGTVDPYNPKVVRATAGAIFAIPVVQFDDLEAVVARCFTERPLVIVADAGADIAYDAVDWREPVILVVGGEAEGARESVRTYADMFINIPMRSDIESLNASVAGSVLVFEIARQRRATP